MADALKNVVRETAARRRATPQRERTPGRTDEVKNNAGGYVFAVSDETRLNRLLIMGSASNTYYVNAKTQAKSDIDFVKKVIAEDPQMVLDAVYSVSTEGRALRQSPTLFVVAALMCYGDADTKKAVRGIFNDVVRTATHLYEVCQYIQDIGKFSTSQVRTIAGWFTSKTTEQLAYQFVKYRSRSV